MKKTVSLLLSLLVMLALSVPAFADGHPDRVVDAADLLSENDETSLRALLDEKSEALAFDIAVVTASAGDAFGMSQYDAISDGDLDYYAVNYYNNQGYGIGNNRDGIILFVFCCDDGVIRWVQPGGDGESYFGDDERFDIGGVLGTMLTYSSFTGYASYCEKVVKDSRSFHWLMWLVIGLVIGVIVALIATGSMKNKLKSVHHQTAAANYVRNGSMEVTESRDTFLYHTITRTPRPQNNATRGGGGGGAHSGSGGRV